MQTPITTNPFLAPASGMTPPKQPPGSSSDDLFRSTLARQMEQRQPAPMTPAPAARPAPAPAQPPRPAPAANSNPAAPAKPAQPAPNAQNSPNTQNAQAAQDSAPAKPQNRGGSASQAEAGPATAPATTTTGSTAGAKDSTEDGTKVASAEDAAAQLLAMMASLNGQNTVPAADSATAAAAAAAAAQAAAAEAAAKAALSRSGSGSASATSGDSSHAAAGADAAALAALSASAADAAADKAGALAIDPALARSTSAAGKADSAEPALPADFSASLAQAKATPAPQAGAHAASGSELAEAMASLNKASTPEAKLGDAADATTGLSDTAGEPAVRARPGNEAPQGAAAPALGAAQAKVDEISRGVRAQNTQGEVMTVQRDSATAPQAMPAMAPAGQATLQAANAVASNQLQARVGSQAWDQQLGQKVVWMAAGGEQSASLTLNPPDLGPLQVVLSISNDQASASFTAAQPEVRQALENALPKLRDMMNEAGIQLGNATVSAGSQEQQEAFARQAGGNRGQGGRGAGAGTAGDDGAAVAAAPQRARSGLGVVDTFA